MKESAVNKIREFIQNMRKEEHIDNQVIRDDVFSILEKKCVVLYFPLEDDDIDGFHVVKNIDGEEKDFVFINSHKKTEGQIFTAAHELGHLLKVFEQIDVNDLDKEEGEEEVVNRFAAELLMPEEIFNSKINEKLAELDYNGHTISRINLARLTAFLMSYFYTPLRSVLIRYSEVGRIKKSDANTLNKDQTFKDFTKQMIDEGGYTRLNKCPDTKSLQDLPFLLAEAKKKKVYSDEYFKVLQEGFSIKDTNGNTEDMSFGGEASGKEDCN